MKIGEFFIDLVVDAAKGELTVGNLIKSMGELEVASVGELAVLAALANKFEQVTKATIASSQALYDYHAMTGASSESLQKWQGVAAHIGMTDVKQLQEIFKNLTIALDFGHRTGNYGGLEKLFEVLPKLGPFLQNTPADKPEKILEFFRNSPEFQRLASATKLDYLTQAGNGLAALQRAVTQGPGGISPSDFAAYQKEIEILNQQQRDSQNEAGDWLTSAEAQARRIGVIVSKWFGPETLGFLKLEAESLKTIADWLDTVDTKKGKASVGKSVLLRQADYLSHPQDIVSDFFIGSKMLGHDAAASFDRATKGLHPLSPPSIMLGPLGQPQKHETNNDIDITIEGSKLDSHQLYHAVKKGIIEAVQGPVKGVHIAETA